MRSRAPSSRQPSYKASLTPVTYYAAICSVTFETVFTVYYWLAAYPRQILVVQAASNLLGLLGFVLILRASTVRAAGHLLAASIYFGLAGPLLFTGGLHSSATPWLVFIPIMVAIIAGARAGAAWGVLCLATALALYFYREPLQAWNLHPVEEVDRLMDLALAVLCGVLAVLGNEMVKGGVMKRLDEAQDQLTDLASKDPLTNIYNRRHFTRQVQDALQDCTADRPLALILFDIDHFKDINDQHGHYIGDQVLVGLICPCASALRKNDVLARLGGEEFVALLPHTSEAEAKEVGERLRNVVENTPIRTDEGPMQITISVGVCSCGSAKTDIVEELIRRADDAMYSAKEAGRNRVVAWSEMKRP